jgi:hypothetical protein
MRRAVLAVLVVAAGCAEERSPAPEPRPTATIAAPRTLIAADLPGQLGAKIAGPQGTDPEFAVIAEGKVVAKVASYVACPSGRTVDGEPVPPTGMTACDPTRSPAGTIYTFVHTITPAEAEMAPSPGTGAEAAAPEEVLPALFRMTRSATGFRGAVGYDLDQAEAALGARDPISITLDNGRLIWRVTKGTGWKPGAPVTVWWQTTAPPAGPQAAFRLELDGTSHRVKAPFPGAENVRTNR